MSSRVRACAAALTFYACLTAEAQQTAPPAQPRAGQGAFPTPLYRMEDVGRSLNLTPNQTTRLNEMTSGLQKRLGEDFQKFDTLPQARRTELMQRYQADWMKSAGDILNERQLERYRQLNYQHQGFDAFNDPDLQKRLNLTDEQRKQLDEGRRWSQEQMQGIQRRGGEDRDAGTRLYQDYWKERGQRLNKILTDEQRRTWGQITGDPYNFQPNFPTTPRR